MPVFPSSTWPTHALEPPPPPHVKPAEACWTPDEACWTSGNIDYAARQDVTRSNIDTWVFDVTSEEKAKAFLSSHRGYDGRVQTLCWAVDVVCSDKVCAGDRVIKRVSSSLEVSAIVDTMLGHDEHHAVFSLRISEFHEASRTVRPSGPLYAYLVIGRDRVSDIYQHQYKIHFLSFQPIYPKLRATLAAVSRSMRGDDEVGDGTFFTGAIIQHFLSSPAMRFFSCEVDSGRTYVEKDLCYLIGHGMHSLRAVGSSGSAVQLAPGHAGDTVVKDDEDWFDVSSVSGQGE